MKSLSAMFCLVFACVNFASAGIVSTPSLPRLGEKLEFSLSENDATGVTWRAAFKGDSGSTETIAANKKAQKLEISSVRAGVYNIAASYKSGGMEKQDFLVFTVLSPQQEAQIVNDREQAETEREKENTNLLNEARADVKFELEKLTPQSIELYIDAKLKQDTRRERTSRLLSAELVSILKKHQDTNDKRGLLEDVKAGSQKILDEERKIQLQLASPDFENPMLEDEKIAVKEVNQAFDRWENARDRLLQRLDMESKDGASLYATLNEVVLPGLGAAAIAPKDRTPTIPVPELNADLIKRILDANSGAGTTPASRRRRIHCIDLLLGF